MNTNYNELSENKNDKTIDEDGNTQLILLVKNGDYNGVKSLIENGADIHATNDYGETALYVALDKVNHNCNIIELLLKNGGVVNIDALLFFPTKKLVELILKYRPSIINETNAYNETLLYIFNDVEGIEFLLKNGANVDIVNNCNETPLLYHLNEFVLIEHNIIDIVKLLIKYSKDPNKLVCIKNKKKQSVLTFASDNLELFNLLIEYIDDINDFFVHNDYEGLSSPLYTNNLEIYEKIVYRAEFDNEEHYAHLEYLITNNIHTEIDIQKFEILKNREIKSKSKSANKKISSN